MWYVGKRIYAQRDRRMASSVRWLMRDGYRIPESLSAFCNIVSLTAAKTSRIFDVSVACVRLRGISTYEM
jgi:hypothetical protein